MYKSNINFNLYKTFYDVAKYESISAAAKNSYTSQPAISKAIKKLEEDLGVLLFLRDKNGVKLTEKGKELLNYVEKSYNNLIIAERNMLESNNLNSGKLAIGMPSNIGSFYVFDKIISFHEQYPNIEITIITGSTSNLLNRLESHEIDFIIDTPPFKINKDIIIEHLSTVNYCFIANKKFNKNINSIKQLENEQLILPINNTANRNDLNEVLNKYKVNINNILNIHTTEMIISAVKQNLGIGYVIEDLVKNEIKNKELIKLNINETLPSIDIDLVYNPNYLTIAPLKFINDFLKQ